MHPAQASQADVRYEGDKFLKVTPNLFTAERLHLFDSMHLYTSLMKCSKAVEQGERLHNLSWRIVNKALLKDGNVNRSKKRDGVRNLYNVLNPSRKQQQLKPPAKEETRAKPQPQKQPSAASLRRREEPRTVTKGFGAPPSSQLQQTKPGKKDKRNTFFIADSPSPETQPRKLPSQQESLFGKRDQVFYSSDDNDSDWDGLSESDSSEDEFPYDDEEEEDSYYRKQWDKLLDKQQPTGQPDHITKQRSLLSGLLRQPSASPSLPQSQSPVAPSPAPSPAPALATSTVTAVGSVTSPQGSLAASMVPPALHQDSSRASRGSFSSIVSESTRERYLHESNAPPAAQTILPRALSTHMFLPNNVHQQRLAAQENKDQPTERRISMDIPGKKRNGALKTRMEISEEEKYVRLVKSYSKR